MSIAAKLATIKATETTKPTIPTGDLNWEQMDVETLPDTIKVQFYSLLKAQEDERNARKAITESLLSVLDLPPHLTVRVAAKWGKLSVAIDKAKRPSSGKPALSLADLVARAEKAAK